MCERIWVLHFIHFSKEKAMHSKEEVEQRINDRQQHLPSDAHSAIRDAYAAIYQWSNNTKTATLANLYEIVKHQKDIYFKPNLIKR